VSQLIVVKMRSAIMVYAKSWIVHCVIVLSVIAMRFVYTVSVSQLITMMDWMKLVPSKVS